MGYFQSQKNPTNEKFVKAIKAKYGQERVVGDPMECGYTGVHFWRLAVEKAKSFDVQKVVAASSNLPLDAPEGHIKLHATNHHTWKHARIGVARADGQFDILHESPLIEPNPFPKL
jgi:urea transport system substrate-binding protein